MTETKIKKNYKDTVFRMIFKEKEHLLSLYNAVNGTHHTNVEDLEITTLENAIYMTYKNDISFVFDFELTLFEHQSTLNPNMPLRDLIYVTENLQGRVDKEKLYSSILIKLPTPRFIVFYNGTTPQPERQVLKLSDAYQKSLEYPELELTVTVLNINYGKNIKLMEACKLLKEYAQYVEKVRGYAKNMSISEAVEKAVNYCIKHDILREFLMKHRAEAIGMSIYEFDEEAYIKGEREIAYTIAKEESIQAIVSDYIEDDFSKEIILEKLQKIFKLDAKQAESYFVKYSVK
ncbi:MAG: hypothetical protein J6A75_10745 [Lachnospiraceae bacterium]|nr:hypothetical protein [Lachnospiraceae bacterium]